jgi:MFS family permease
MGTLRGSLTFTLVVLFLINTLNFYDRQVLGAAAEKVKTEWDLSDQQLSDLVLAFILLYAAVGLPLGHWADVGRRKVILSAGVVVWSVFTALSGWAWNYGSLFLFRMGVGVGEASCAPAANSLLGDLFPPGRRARAIAVFMLGLPLGLGSCHIATGYIIRHLNWHAAFYVAGVPGLLLGVLAWFLPEPPRGSSEQHGAGARRRPGWPIFAVLRIPTLWWIILSGAILNFCMYALGSFLTSFLIRFHRLDYVQANWISGVAYGFGGLGMLVGGWLADRAAQRGAQGRMQVAAVAMLLATPCFALALQQPEGRFLWFAVCLLPGCVCLYVYYSTVYATIQDVVEPALRGTAMAVYFFVFYLVAAAGLHGFGWLSDTLATRAAAEGASAADARAIGLHQAMYALPLLTLVLTGVLYAGSRTVVHDYRKLQEWLAEVNAAEAKPAG